MIRDDCCMYDPKKISCTGLKVLVCAYTVCKFFKTEEQAETEKAACRERLARLGARADREN